jgi:hypothetical protein
MGSLAIANYLKHDAGCHLHVVASTNVDEHSVCRSELASNIDGACQRKEKRLACTSAVFRD